MKPGNSIKISNIKLDSQVRMCMTQVIIEAESPISQG